MYQSHNVLEENYICVCVCVYIDRYFLIFFLINMAVTNDIKMLCAFLNPSAP